VATEEIMKFDVDINPQECFIFSPNVFDVGENDIKTVEIYDA
jgi:hypothetical protein